MGFTQEPWEAKIYRKRFVIFGFFLLFVVISAIFVELSFREIYYGKRENRFLWLEPEKNIYKYWFLGKKGVIPRYINIIKFTRNGPRARFFPGSEYK